MSKINKIKNIKDIEDVVIQKKANILTEDEAIHILTILQKDNIKHQDIQKFIESFWTELGKSFGKAALIAWYKQLCFKKVFDFDRNIMQLLVKKQSRADYGVFVNASVLSPNPGVNFRDNPLIWFVIYFTNSTAKIDDNFLNILKNKSLEEISHLKSINNDFYTHILLIHSKLKNNDNNFNDSITFLSKYLNYHFSLDFKQKKFLDETTFGCKFDCDFCPKMPGQARSYVPGEPAVDRANKNMFDPYLQLKSRLNMYIDMGHIPDKLEVIILGGTLDSYFGYKVNGMEYFEWFICSTYYCANTYNDDIKRKMLSLQEERIINESKIPHIIGLTIETRPDMLTKGIKRYRQAGTTRIQIGIQHYGSPNSDKLLKRISRGCYSKHTEQAIITAKRCCFKIDGHFMPDLPHPFKENKTKKYYKDGIKEEHIDYEVDILTEDLMMYWEITYGENCQVDQRKDYPTEIMEYTELYEQYKNGIIKCYGDKWFLKEELEEKYKFSSFKKIDNWDEIIEKSYIPWEDFYNNFFSFIHEYVLNETEYHEKEKLKPKNRKKDLGIRKFNILRIFLIYVTMHVRPWIRINRTVRDIPESYHKGGVKESNTRQYLIEIMRRNNWKTNDIRTRTIKNSEFSKYSIDDVKFRDITYNSSGGVEHFLEYYLEIDGYKKCVGFLRLRFDEYAGMDYKNNVIFPELINCALIRELHVYGSTTDTTNNDKFSSQHKGFGTKLLQKAFEISFKNDFNTIAVISGDGVKNYYRKFGFEDYGDFLVKDL